MGALAVLGAGAWGTAIAVALAPRNAACLWARDAAHARSIDAERRNAKYLPEIPLPPSLRITADFDSAIGDAGLLIVATPVSGLREVAKRIATSGVSAPLVWLCKGFEQETGLLPHQIVEAELGERYPSAVLSGPSFALEVARGLPCALTLASRDAELARSLAAQLHGAPMRIYHSRDVIGVEIGGAVKNVLALAVGISDGLGLGQNARAALITRGLAEITRLGLALGALPETLMGLSCAGDLILTATGDLSRNRRVGLELARGRPIDAIVASLGHVAEGVRSAREVAKLAARHGVAMPVSEAVNAVLEGRLSAPQAVQSLLARAAKGEA
jgi:glycerol-3-phosphate dehydrogenase (NAD(P)+)